MLFNLLSTIKKKMFFGRAQVNLDPQSIEKIPCMSDPMFEGLKRKATTGF
jgi:hypothetical protein